MLGHALTCFLVFGCSVNPTQPNISAVYRITVLRAKLPLLSAEIKEKKTEPAPMTMEAEAIFVKLYELNPNLALELGKLPEFQGTIGEKQVSALKRFTELLANASQKEKARLDEYLAVGKPEVRKYCAPLQAAFWLLEKAPKYNPLQYSVDELIIQIWNFEDKEKWGNFGVVTERLNSPYLISYFQEKQFFYEYHTKATCPINAKYIFATRNGCCRDYTAFAVYCMQKAGYQANPILVKSPTSSPYHVVCEFEDNATKYVLDALNGGVQTKERYTQSWPQIGYGYSL